MADLQKVINKLEAFYGRPSPPKVTCPLEIIILENVACLVDDQRREALFEAFEPGGDNLASVGLSLLALAYH